MKKFLLIFASVLILTGCGANGQSLECVREGVVDEQGVERNLKLKVTEKDGKLASYRDESELKFPAGGAGMGEEMETVRTMKDTYGSFNGVNVTYSIDGDNLIFLNEIDFKTITDEEYAAIQSVEALNIKEDASQSMEAMKTVYEGTGATCTLK